MANYEFPTEVIDLPSKGKVYPESNPLSKGSIEIKYMTDERRRYNYFTKFDKEGGGGRQVIRINRS